MNSITVRAANNEKFHQLIPGIVRVFRNDEAVPWRRVDECRAWVKRRAERGFYITATWYDGQIAGCGEWIETFKYREGTKTALALYWSGESVTAETVGGIFAQGDRSGFKK